MFSKGVYSDSDARITFMVFGCKQPCCFKKAMRKIYNHPTKKGYELFGPWLAQEDVQVISGKLFASVNSFELLQIPFGGFACIVGFVVFAVNLFT
jgi:hypothetical protein